MKSIAFGTHLPVMGFVREETISREQLISFAQKAEELGYDSLSVNDHLVFRTGWLDAISSLSAIAATTHRIKVTAVAERNGILYAAATGGKPAAPAPSSVPGASSAKPAATLKITGQQATAPAVPSLLSASPAGIALGGSDFYRIEADGSAEKMWTSLSDVIYAIGFDAQGLPLLGTGNKGVVYRVDSATLSTQLLNAPPTQVTAFLAGRSGVLYAATGNVGKLYAIGPGYEKSGTLESDVLDVDSFAYWGKTHLLGDFEKGTVELSTRSGNVNRPQKNWSDWTPTPISPLGDKSRRRRRASCNTGLC